jgi:hypothetical protein
MGDGYFERRKDEWTSGWVFLVLDFLAECSRLKVVKSWVRPLLLGEGPSALAELLGSW